MPYICKCGQKLDIPAALDAIPPDRMGSAGMFVPTCRGCGENGIEVRLVNGGFDVGYSYFGGSMHFEALQRVSIKGLKISRSDPDDLYVVIGSRCWHFGIRRSASTRFIALPGAYAVGKRIDELDFAQWDVTLTALERNHSHLELKPETVISAEDFLYFSGPSPALTRTWLYINDGRSKTGV